MRKKGSGSRTPAISVVVLTLNEEATISKCLDSIINQHFPRSRFEVIVVDGYSTDRTREIAELYTSRILLEDRHTFGSARNLGVSSARGKYVAFVSADAWAEPDWLENICKAFSSRRVAGIVGRQLPITSSGWVSKIRSVGFEGTYSNGPRWMGMGDNFSTVNCAYTREAILGVGGFDESLLACEDQDLGHRILQDGLGIIYDPSMTVHHTAEDSLIGICRKTFRQGIGEGICISRYRVWSERLYLSILLLLMLVVFPLAFLVGFLRSIVGILLNSTIFLFLLAVTWLAMRVFQVTRDWKTFLGAYVYYPTVGLAELLGFLVGRLTAHRSPAMTVSQT